MKKRILACVVTITLISMLLVGCTSVNSTDETSDRIDNMFVRVGWNSCCLLYTSPSPRDA